MSQQLPPSPQLSSLRKQAKTLLRGAHAGSPEALARFRTHLPALHAHGSDTPPAAGALRLHDAQSVLAREHGFRSWTELKRTVEFLQADRADRLKTWLNWVYEGTRRERRLAVRMLADDPTLLRSDPANAAWIACAVGDEGTIRHALAGDPAWVNRAGGPCGMPPLVAVTHSMLLLEPALEDALLAAAQLLLAHGADPNSTWTDPRFAEWPLSAIYGAAGRTHHPGMLQLLLAAGASPDDNESLYHSLETSDPTCTRILLAHGARVRGTNAVAHALDYGSLDVLDLLLDQARRQHSEAGATGPLNDGPWIHHAILRGSPLLHIQHLIEAGVDLHTRDREGIPLPRFAALHGRTDVLDLLRSAGVTEPGDQLSDTDQFIAACARGDLAAARSLLALAPGLLGQLSPRQLQALPEQAAIGNVAAVRTMLSLGWPIEIKAAWDATALNLAVYRGDATLADLLLQHGADWRTLHGYKNNVFGTLSHASQSDPEDPTAPKDFLGCARALIRHGAPVPDPDRYAFSPDVTDFFDTVRLSQTPPN